MLMVTVADMEADNGVVHVIDAVLVPSFLQLTVVDIIVNSADHNTLEAAVIAAGLEMTLSGANGPFTVFAPTDAAFAALPAGTVDDLLGRSKRCINRSFTVPCSSSKAMSSDLSDGQMIETVFGKDVTVKIDCRRSIYQRCHGNRSRFGSR